MTDLAIIWAASSPSPSSPMSCSTASTSASASSRRFAQSDEEEETMISAIAPVWDGNETWLVLGGGGLMAAFPLAYSMLLPALYAPLIAMLLALIFRGVAFEFRHRHEAIAALDMGLRARLLCRDIRARAGARHRSSRASRSRGAPMPAAGSTGSRRSACSPARRFSLAMRCSARCFLIMKTEGPLQERMFGCALPLGAAGARRDRGRQPVDAVPRSGARGALVLLAEHRSASRPFRSSWSWLRASGSSAASPPARQVMPFVIAILLFLVAYCGRRDQRLIPISCRAR